MSDSELVNQLVRELNVLKGEMVRLKAVLSNPGDVELVDGVTLIHGDGLEENGNHIVRTLMNGDRLMTSTSATVTVCDIEGTFQLLPSSTLLFKTIKGLDFDVELEGGSVVYESTKKPLHLEIPLIHFNLKTKGGRTGARGTKYQLDFDSSTLVSHVCCIEPTVYVRSLEILDNGDPVWSVVLNQSGQAVRFSKGQTPSPEIESC